MANQTPDWSQTWQRAIEAVQVFTDARNNLTTNAATSYLNQENLILTDNVFLDSDVDALYKAGLNVARQAFSTSIASAAGLLNSCLLELARVMGMPQTSPSAILPVLYQYMALGSGGSKTPAKVNSRNISYGTWTAGGSNVGTGTFVQLSVDAYGNSLESGFCEVMTWQCVADANSGTNPGQEQFSAEGQPFRDALARYVAGYGSGINQSIGSVGITADTTAALVLNSSFSQSSGTNFTSGFLLNNWTITSGAANLGLNTSTYYRASAIEGTTPASLQAQGNFVITQTLGSRSANLGPLLPYLFQAAVDGTPGTWVGSITFAVGALSWSISSGGSNWVLSRPTIGKGIYFQNFNQAALAVTITGTVSSGYVLIDDFLFAPFTNVGQGGFQYASIGGATNWLVNDTGTITNTEGTAAKVQREFSESYGWSLPSVIQSAGGAAPTVTPSAGAGMTTGTHAFAYTYYNGTTNVESKLSAITYANLDGTNGTAALSGVTTGPAGTTQRFVYATRVTTSTAQPVMYFAGAIADNATTTKNITTADAALLLAPGLIQDPAN